MLAYQNSPPLNTPFIVLSRSTACCALSLDYSGPILDGKLEYGLSWLVGVLALRREGSQCTLNPLDSLRLATAMVLQSSYLYVLPDHRVVMNPNNYLISR